MSVHCRPTRRYRPSLLPQSKKVARCNDKDSTEHGIAGSTRTEIWEIKKLWPQLICTLLNIICLFLGVGNFLCPRLVEGRYLNIYLLTAIGLSPGGRSTFTHKRCRCNGATVCRQTYKLLPLTFSSGNIQRLPHSTVVSVARTVANCLSFSPVPVIRSTFYCLPASASGASWIGLLFLNTRPFLCLIT